MLITLTSSGSFLVLGVGSFTRWGTGSDKGTVATAADAQRLDRRKQFDQAFIAAHKSSTCLGGLYLGIMLTHFLLLRGYKNKPGEE